jgi:hypothetical protein
MTLRTLSARPGSLALLVSNVIGAIAYVLLASVSWAIPQEAGLHSETAEPVVWGLTALPIFAVFSLINLTWGALILARRQWRSGSWWLVAALIWLVAVAIDFAHH